MLFVNFELRDILSIQATALDALKNGGRVLTWTSESTSATFDFGDMSIRDILNECNAALSFLLPEVYGPPTKKARAIFR